MMCFLDRDGIINYDYGYVGSFERFKWIEEIFPILLLLKERGYDFAIVTNQSGIGRGYYSQKDFYDISFYIINTFSKFLGIEVDINFCPHHPQVGCQCRKPAPGMFKPYNITKSDIMIGDSSTDMESSRLAGISNRCLISDVPSGPFTKHFHTHSCLLTMLETTSFENDFSENGYCA